MSFEIEYDKQPVKFLKNQDKHITERIINKIEEVLSENPVPHNAKRLQKEKDLSFTIMVGDYRVLYRINYQDKKIIVFKIDKRPRVYD